MTPKEKAIDWMDNYTNKVKITKEDVEESVDIALQKQAKEISEDIINYIKQKYLHNPVIKRDKE